MRLFAIAMTLGLAVGCASESAQLQYESTLYDETRGIVLQDDVTAQAGMFENTCEIEIANAWIGQDVDVAQSVDMVEDTFDGVILVRGPDGLHLYNPSPMGGEGEVSTPDVPGIDIVDGALVTDGVVVVSSSEFGIAIDWTADSVAGIQTGLSGLTALSVDRESGAAFVAADGEVLAATPDSADAIGAGDLVSWDATSEVLFVADLNGGEVRGLEADGGVRFATSVDGRITALASLNGQAVVSVALDDGGALVVLDGMTGEILRVQGTPGSATELVASQSGNKLAVVLGASSEVHFFSVRD